MADVEVHIDLRGSPRPIGRARSQRVRGAETILFEYGGAWLKDPDRFSLQPALALTRGTFAPPAGLATFGAIGDSAPDTWGRRVRVFRAHPGASPRDHQTGRGRDRDMA